MSEKLPLIPVYRPSLDGNEERYVLDCVRSSWISSIGSYVDRFEQSFTHFTGAKHAIAVSNGTVALHLIYAALGIGPGDEVIVPTFTYIASVNTIAQTGAKPVFVDCQRGNWLIDPADVEKKITKRTKAICVVHLFGAIAEIKAIKSIADKHNIPVVEDCAEVFGATEAGIHAGLAGIASAFSFFGNKTITTGEGGMVICQDPAFAARLRKLKGQGQSSERRYWHDELGFNYRMTNICAAIGLAQMERADDILRRKREIASFYELGLAGSGCEFQQVRNGVSSSHWLFSVLVPAQCDRDRVIAYMSANGIETRPVFYCANHMPMYADGRSYPASLEISSRGISLPSYPDLSRAEQERVISTFLEATSIRA